MLLRLSTKRAKINAPFELISNKVMRNVLFELYIDKRGALSRLYRAIIAAYGITFCEEPINGFFVAEPIGVDI